MPPKKRPMKIGETFNPTKHIDRRVKKTKRNRQQKGMFSSFGPKFKRKGERGFTRNERGGSRRKPGPKPA